MTLLEILTELRNRGFSGFSAADLTTYANRGYFAVGRRSRWYWEQTTSAFTLNPGQFAVTVGGVDLPNFRSLDKLAVTTTGQKRRLREMDEGEFFDQWFPQDLTTSAMQGEPSHYYLWGDQLYILPPPNSARDFLADYHQRLTALVNNGDTTITPSDLDEAVMLAAVIRCHTRSNEPALAALASQELQEIYDDMLDEEETRIGEHQNRVKPDDTWL